MANLHLLLQGCNQGMGWAFASRLAWSLTGLRSIRAGGLRASASC